MIVVSAFIVAWVVAYLLTPLIIRYARQWGLVTDVAKRHHPAHTHTGVIPRGGGIPIYIALVVATWIFIPLEPIVVGILLGTGMLLIVGVLDDYYDMSPYVRFGLNILIAAFVVGFGLGVPYVSNPFGGVIRLDQWIISLNIWGERTILVWADIFSIIWLVSLMNMINWSKGVDGQLPGFVAITAFFLGIISQRFVAHDIHAETVTMLSFIVAGAYLGFLPYNMYPQRIMPGYGGGALAGFLLGIISILSFGKLGTAILVLAIPLMDATYTIFRRVRKGVSPFKADWGHLHHRLLEIGWGRRRIALFYWSVSFILGVASLTFVGVYKVLALVGVACALVMFILVIEDVKKKQKG